MNIGEFREMMEGLPDHLEVRMMIQPSWPLQFEVEGIYLQADMISGEDDILYLVQGSHPAEDPYGDALAWEMVERP